MKTLRNIFLIGLVLFSASCKDFLDEKGYNTDYTYYETASGLNALIISAYQNLRWAATSENMFKLEDMGTDLYMVGGDGGNREAYCQFRTDYLTTSEGTISGFWANNYKCIYVCNLALKYLSTNTDMAAATKVIREGEIKFLRAYYYAQLATQFGDVPLVLEATSSPKTDFLRSPQKDIWNLVISDLRRAWDCVPWADASGCVTGDYGRIGKGAVGHLLAQTYMYRYCGLKFAASQTNTNMVEDRGGKTTDLDSVIYYAGSVCNYNPAVTGSLHTLATNYSDLWIWDDKTGTGLSATPKANYTGSEALFTINFSSTPFYNNTSADDYGAGNTLHFMYTAQFQSIPVKTQYDNVSVTHGNTIGLVRDFYTGRPWKRLAPSYWYFSDDGLYGPSDYETAKKGKMIDSRLYKSHQWVLFSNATPDYKWKAFSNAAGSFDPATIGKVAGTQKYAIGDTCIVLSLENIENRYTSGTQAEKLALARESEKYVYYPMNSSIFKATTFALASAYNNGQYSNHLFPSSAKWLDSRRKAINDGGGYKPVMCYRLAETWILLSEAYARKANYVAAAECLNKVRERAAWKDGETKDFQFWKYDGGSYADRQTSTVADMKVSTTFIQNLGTEGTTPSRLTDFYLDEYGRETAGELKRFDQLVRYGADYWYNRVRAHNEWVWPTYNGINYGGNMQIYHRFRPIPQSVIDGTHPEDPNPQNYGY